jgi:hypothetical protein
MAAIWRWEHFRRHDGLQPYQNSYLRYAICKFCTAEQTITHADEIKAELEKDRSKGRARALGAGFILGRAREMSRHLKRAKRHGQSIESTPLGTYQQQPRSPPKLSERSPTQANNKGYLCCLRRQRGSEVKRRWPRTFGFFLSG